MLPDGWRGWRFWQHTSSGHVAGINGSVDLDAFAGTRAERDHLRSSATIDAGADSASPTSFRGTARMICSHLTPTR
jgi:hypothetical protein